MMALQKGFRSLSIFKNHFRRISTSYLSPKLEGLSKDPSDITVEEYKTRRKNLIKLCLDSEPWRTSRNLLLCVPAAPPAYYSDQILYPFRQNTDFNYLCGYPKPNCVLILFTESGKEENFKSILFVPQPFEHQRIWDGEFEGEDSIARSTGVDEVKFTKDIASFLSTFVTDNSKFSLWYNYQKAVNPDFHKSVMADFLRQGKYKKLESCDLFVQSLRVVKSPGEIALIRKSMEITEAAFAAVDHMVDEWQSKRSKNSPLFEYEIQAVMEYVCQLNGGRLAYIPVIAGGNRGTTIHYVQNNHKIDPRELLLIDAGCEYKGYTTDITRVLNFSNLTYEQKVIIGLVQLVQEACIQMCTPQYSLNDIYRRMITIIGEYLQVMGFLDLKLEGKQFDRGADRFCPHHVGHYLGMDLHDTPLVSKEKKLQPGTLLTIEPGLYLRPEYIPENLSLFKGIAVRLEENILVTEKDPINLSEKVSPREKSFLARDADECMIDEKAQRIIAKLISNTGIK